MQTDTLHPTDEGIVGIAQLGTKLANDPTIRLFGRATSRGLVFFVEGYASRRSSDTHNLELSKRRAMRVEQILRERLPSMLRDNDIPLGRGQLQVAPPGWYGEDLWRRGGVPESNDEERYRTVRVRFYAFASLSVESAES
jgi:hypothetical protein